ncbi:MAG TPA: pyrroline-5-carboxylate reductase, partial [Erysipelotrichaceae bacterium]|nr:pyrroline-5-carboxylate reductase [Erysipelotrichaceae bacterium]
EVLPSHLMGVGGALSGCAPAYIYMVIEALADGAVAQGLPRASAYKLASQTVLGSGKMQLASGLHPGILKDNVTSPAGSTIKGVKALEDGGLRAAFISAIEKSMGK